jgi:copper chaperone
MAVQRETLRIEGMGCGHCVKAVEEALGAVEGVEVHVVEIGSAQISYDPETTDPARLAEAVEEAGYTVPALA